MPPLVKDRTEVGGPTDPVSPKGYSCGYLQVNLIPAFFFSFTASAFLLSLSLLNDSPSELLCSPAGGNLTHLTPLFDWSFRDPFSPAAVAPTALIP